MQNKKTSTKRKEALMKFRAMFICIIFVGINLILAKEINKEKLSLIEKMMETLNMKSQMAQLAGNMISIQVDQITKKNPGISDSLRYEIKKTIADVFMEGMEGKEGLYNKLYGVYDKYLNENDLKAIIAFYSSDVGKKFVELSPQMMQESIQLGKIWGENLSPIITDRLIKKFKKEKLNIGKI